MRRDDERATARRCPATAAPAAGRALTRTLLPALALAAALLLACGAGRSAPSENSRSAPLGESGAAAGGGEVHTYVVRGVVRDLPDPARPASELQITHGPIPDWVNSEGQETGMMGMTMPFPLASGVSLAGLALGDPIELTLEVRWKAEVPLRITKLRKLRPEELTPPAPPTDGQEY